MREGMTYKRLGDLVNIRTGKLDANAASLDGQYPFFTCSKEPLRIDSYSYDCECVLVAGNGDLNVKYYKGKFDAYQRTYIIELKPGVTEITTYYLYLFFMLYVQELRIKSIGGIIKYIKLGDLTEAKIPIPSLNEQQRIVSELDRLASIISDKQQQLRELDNLAQAIFYSMFGDPLTNPKGWETIMFEDSIDKIKSTSKVPAKSYKDNGKFPIVSQEDERISGYWDLEQDVFRHTKPVVVFGDHTRCVKYIDFDFVVGADGVKVLLPNDKFNSRFYYHCLKSTPIENLGYSRHYKLLRDIKIPLPPLDLQQQFAEKVQTIEEQKDVLKQSIAEFENLLAQRMEYHFA